MPTTLEVLLARLGLRLIAGDPQLTISNVTSDSRQVENGSLFIAVSGLRVDGHAYVDQAIAAGASAIVVQKGRLPQNLNRSVAWIESDDTARAAGELAAEFYENPSQNLNLIGITGTNGKTTVATLCHQLFTQLGHTCGLIGTVEIRIGSETFPATHTTPDAIALQKTLANMVEGDCEYVFMEVSSHALHQQRTAGCRWAGGVFTNISHDHLDYHGDMKAYISAKKLLFDQLPAAAFALVNTDDKRGMVMLQNTKANQVTYALRQFADYKGKILDEGAEGLHLLINEVEFYTRITGHFNAYNLLAAYGCAVECGLDSLEALTALSAATGAAGRLERVQVEGVPVLGLVDYAHTPDALLNVLKTLQTFRRSGHRIITVFGCGGDRDRTKRPVMGRHAAEHSDQAIITDDNPRTESPEIIRQEIEAGVPSDFRARTLTLADRRQAIRTAVSLAREGDVILVAGKGHETYQEIDGKRHHFDDREVLTEAFKERKYKSN